MDLLKRLFGKKWRKDYRSLIIVYTERDGNYYRHRVSTKGEPVETYKIDILKEENEAYINNTGETHTKRELKMGKDGRRI